MELSTSFSPLYSGLRSSSRSRVKLLSTIFAPPVVLANSARFSTIPPHVGRFNRGNDIPLGIGSVRQRKLKKNPFFVPRASAMENPGTSSYGDPDMRILSGAAIAVVLAVANRVLYKLALIPMKEFPFFLAQLTTFGYVAVYMSILYFRCRLGIVTKEMLSLPKSPFLAVGALEAIGVAVGMSAGAMLPGPVIPILTQAFLVWQLVFSSIILRRNYSFNQILGCLLVAGGVIIALSSGLSGGQLLSKEGLFWPLLMIASTAFQAAASIIKEFIFLDAAKRLQGKPLDIFVVNSFGSAFQALFVFLLLPFLSNLKGIPFAELPGYMSRGAGCFLNSGSEIGCEGAPLLPLVYMLVNMSFNISLLSLVKISSAVVSSLSVTLSVPIAIYIFTLPLPLIPRGSSLDAFFLIGTGVLVLGLMIYNLPRSTKTPSKAN
ncbi:CRT (chloroquine-resistance transporter)-like transporter 2 [Wolffia australiana]